MTDDYEVHVSSWAWRSSLWRKRRVDKLVMLDAKEVYPVNSYVLAAVEIQRVWRGVLLRRRVLAKYLYRTYQPQRATDSARVHDAYRAMGTPHQRVAESCRRRVISRIRTLLRQTDYQRWVAYQKHTIYYVAATTIARQWLQHRQEVAAAEAGGGRAGSSRPGSRVVASPFYLTREDASAARIQRCWKRFINRQIFQFYVELIKFREQGDARLMLKCINPNEAALIDAASGLHVRFRLGGPGFPPTIYYKIYTHAPVCDLGSLAPRDYTKQRKVSPAMLHNNTHVPGFEEEYSTWYRRTDGNGWRPISEKQLREVDEHAASLNEIRKGFTEESPFHYSKLKRRENKEKQVRQKRRQWMLKLYQPKIAADRGVGGGRGDAAVAAADELSDRELEEEILRLVNWSNQLDFEAYQKEWTLLATASGDA